MGGSKLYVSDVSFIQTNSEPKSNLKIIKDQFKQITLPLIPTLID